MPELAELETVKRVIDPQLKNRRIVEIVDTVSDLDSTTRYYISSSG